MNENKYSNTRKAYNNLISVYFTFYFIEGET